MCLQEVLDDLYGQIEQLKTTAASSSNLVGGNGNPSDGSSTVCVTSDGVPIQSAIVVSSAISNLRFTMNRDQAGAEVTARQAAVQAAALNADAGNVPGYTMLQVGDWGGVSQGFSQGHSANSTSSS
jgi:hypothetical protein